MFDPGGTLEELRSDVRDWCATHVPKDWRERQRGVSHEALVEFLRWWGGELREAGLLAPHWPKEWGGGFSIPEQVVIAEELARAYVPRNALYHVGIFNVAPTLVHSATAAQRERYLPGIWNGEVWCQGYSEPASRPARYATATTTS
jgi:alkylation response protein AidB-like acyl-CoA dehydrogenase